jgi:hypothetical protein
MRYILAMWNQEGFECLQDITDKHPDNFEKGQIMDILKGNKAQSNPLNQQLSTMKLRAGYNSQRCYEIYVFSTNDALEFKDLEDWMNTDPQSLVEWIRVNHYSKVYSDYRPKHKTKIV